MHPRRIEKSRSGGAVAKHPIVYTDLYTMSELPTSLREWMSTVRATLENTTFARVWVSKRDLNAIYTLGGALKEARRQRDDWKRKYEREKAAHDLTVERAGAHDAVDIDRVLATILQTMDEIVSGREPSARAIHDARDALKKILARQARRARRAGR